jgi:hypothetical protein
MDFPEPHWRINANNPFRVQQLPLMARSMGRCTLRFAFRRVLDAVILSTLYRRFQKKPHRKEVQYLARLVVISVFIQNPSSRP